MEREFNSYRNYVCPECFNQLDKCTCEIFPPYGLIMIDEGIQEHIRTLRNKGYITIGCCEGHFNSYSAEPYIAFGIDYAFDDIPDGYKWNKNRRTIIGKHIKTKSKEKYEEIRKEMLDNLMEWVNNL